MNRNEAGEGHIGLGCCFKPYSHSFTLGHIMICDNCKDSECVSATFYSTVYSTLTSDNCTGVSEQHGWTLCFCDDDFQPVGGTA